MTDLVAKARALAQAATPGPWKHGLDCFSDNEDIVAVVADDKGLLVTIETGIMLHQQRGPVWTAEDSHARDERWRQARAGQGLRDAAFIAASRALIPELCNALEAAERERDDATARASLEAAHHEHLRKERDEARVQRDSALARAWQLERELADARTNTFEADRQLATVTDEIERMGVVARDFCDEAYRLDRDRDRRGGQHVPYHGDWAAATPSIVSAVRRWAAAFRAAIDRSTTPEAERE